MGGYTSAYTGDELDLTISRVLGDTYRGDASPGCHLIGDKSEMPVFLNDITIPGKYTIYFYYSDPEFLADSAISPIFLHVYWSGQMLYQTIRIGPRLYWRDLISGDLTWKMIDMGIEAVRVVDNLYTDLDKDESADEMALSANMGAELRKMIEAQHIGNINLLDCTGTLQGYADSREYSRFDKYWTFVNAHYMFDATSSSVGTDKISDISNDENVGTTVFVVKRNGYVLSNGSYFKSGSAYYEPFTASVYLRLIWNVDGHFSDEYTESDKVYIKIIVKYDDSSYDDIVVTKEYSIKDIYTDPKCNADVFRLSVTLNKESFGNPNVVDRNINDNLRKRIYVCFGVECGEYINQITFTQPKLEYGDYATQYNHSTNDLMYWYTNCEKIFDVDINATTPSDFNEQDGLVYNSSTEEFDHEPVAVGGGGGFNIYNTESDAASNTRKDKILVFIPGNDTSANPKRLMYWNGSKFINAVPDALIESSTGNSIPYGSGWLDVTNETDSIPAILKYYDDDRKKWRPVGAAASQIWTMSENPPTDPALNHLIWVKESTMAPYICVNGQWRPLLTIWGAST